MKRNLLLLFALTAGYCVQAQDILLTEDCSALTAGPVGTVNGAGTTQPNINTDTPGQGGWTPYCNVAIADSDIQITDMGGTNGNAFQLTGSVDASGNRRLYKSYATVWSGRTPGNDITEMEFDLFTGPNDGTENNSRSYIFDKDRGSIYGGFYFDKTGSETSGVNMSLRGIFRTPVTAANSIRFRPLIVDNTDPLNPVFTDVILAENTWYHLGVSVDFNINKVIWKVTEISTGTVLATTYLDDTIDVNAGTTTTTPEYAETAGKLLGLAEFTEHAGTNNTVASTVAYDNIVVRTVATSTLLGTKQNTLPENKFAVSPNPAKDVIRITNSENISVKGIAISDLNGRVVKSTSYNDASNIQVNVSDLASGMYLMKITSDKGVATKKIVKN